MNRIIIIAGMIGICLSFSLMAQEQYSRVKIYTDRAGLQQLAGLGVAVDHGQYKKDTWFIGEFSAAEIRTIETSGFRYEVLIEDVIAHYHRQNQEASRSGSSRSNHCPGSGVYPYPTPAGFTLGSMGGYFTLDEMIEHLDTMAARFPDLITAKQAFTTDSSIEGRPVYWVRISDNPNQNETEPEMLYTALHHAREPASLSQLIFYMYYLLENYATDPEIQYLVDNTELYFVPCVNPDGYVYNEITNPNGGGLWRLNRRLNQGGTYGVDLNRNYGHEWAFDDIGSSPIEGDQTYRGTGPFSEPETSIIKQFCEDHNFLITLNYHTQGNLLIYPWGYIPALLTPDSSTFLEFARLMTRQNNYTYGTGDQTVGYVVNGDSDDWMYGEQTAKNKIFAMTPEVGPNHWFFWPPDTEIEGLCRDNVWQNLSAARLLTNYAVASIRSPEIVISRSSRLAVDLMRMGLTGNGNFTVLVEPLDTLLSFTDTARDFNAMTHLEIRPDSFAYTINPAVNSGEAVTFLVKVDNGSFVFTDTASLIYITGSVSLSDPGDDMGNWDNSSWNISTTVFHSPPSSFTDSPGGDYTPNQDSKLKLLDAFDLTGAVDAYLSFWARWEIEPNYDYVEVEASTDGQNWQPLCGRYTSTGSQYQDPGEPVYHGYQTDWVKEQLSLKDFIGGPAWIRFKIVSDQAVEEDGFYFDDLEVVKVASSLQAEMVVSDTLVCAGDTLWVETNILGADQYTWRLDGNPVSNQQSAGIPLTAKGNYTIRLTIHQDSQADSTELQIRVIDEVPQADFSFVQQNQTFQFTDKSTIDPVSYSWDFGDGGQSNLPDPTHSYTASGGYLVCLTTTNPCGSDTHCEDISVIIDGLATPGQDRPLRVYPNPVMNRLFLENPGSLDKEVTLNIYNVLGARVHHDRLSIPGGETTSFDTGFLPQGVYWISLSGQSGTVKLVKVK